MRSQPTEQTDNNIATFTGDGTSGVYVYGAQLEQGSYPTSYIISNSGTTTTRLADTSSTTGLSSVINSTEGVLYFEGSAFDVGSGNNKSITLSDATNSNSIVLITGIVANKITVISRVGGTEVSTRINGTITANVTSKIAARWGNGFISLWIDGSEINEVAKSAAATANSITYLNFQNVTGVEPFYGNCQNLQIFKTALTDTELAILTTI